MLISAQSTYSYRIGSSMNILWVCVWVCDKHLDLVNKHGPSRVHEQQWQGGNRIEKKTTTRASRDCCFWRQSSYLKQDMQATHTLTHTHTESRTNRSTRQPQPQPSRLLWFRLRRRLRLHVHYINPVPVPVRFFFPTPHLFFLRVSHVGSGRKALM